MKSLAQIRIQLARGDYLTSRYALRRIVERNIREAEICEVGARAVIIEDYPLDKYSPSCLLLSFTEDSAPLHIHVSRADGEKVRIITIYRPNPEEWDDSFAVRR